MLFSSINIWYCVRIEEHDNVVMCLISALKLCFAIILLSDWLYTCYSGIMVDNMLKTHKCTIGAFAGF